MIDGKPVTEIDSDTFRYSDCIEVYIPDSVTSISDSSFYLCSSLERIIVSKNNKYFYSEDGVLYKLNAYYNVVYYNSWENNIILMHYPNNHGGSSFRIPDGVEVIGRYAFANSDIKEVIFPDSLIVIEKNAFNGSWLEGSITLSSKIRLIESGAFSGCQELKELNISKNNTAYCSVDGVLFSKDMRTLVVYPSGRESTIYQIPDGVISIYDAAFECSLNLEEVIFPNGLRSIGRFAFNLNMLIDLQLPDTLETIAMSAFENSLFLREVVVPKSVTTIEDGAFWATPLRAIYFEHDKSQKIFIDENPDTFSSKPTFYGVSGGSAEEYAKKKNFNFIATD